MLYHDDNLFQGEQKSMSINDLRDHQFLEKLRRDMLRFAELQLRDRAQAEDAVQDALAAALAKSEQFDSRAAVRTWVLAILKNKIVDALRQRRRLDTVALDDDDGDLDAFFDQRGHWTPETRPSDWGDPEASLESRRFWEVFETCLYRLPENTARAYLMREVIGFDSDEICQTLGISASNCWVLLHRARLGLRACLGETWFAGQAA